MDEARCRICFQGGNELISIFTNHENSSPYQKLQQLKLIQSVQINGLSYICTLCLLELDNCVKFLKKCENSNKIISSKYTSQEVQNENFDGYSEAKHLEKNVETIRNDEGSPDLEIPVQQHQYPVCNPCTECGSKRNCVHKPPTLYVCDICRKVFTKKFNYTIHVKRHLGLREWPCPTCGVPQVSSWHAKRHCRSGSRFFCPSPNCTRSYTSAHNLTVHIRNHTGDRPHKCTECGKQFTSKTTLNDHARRHTGVKPYMCSVCGVRFTTNKLAAHLRTHNQSKPRDRQPIDTDITRSRAGMYACSQCSMRYSHKQSLNRHLRKRHATNQKQNESEDNILNINNECS